jgi:predicted small secreted protein
MPYYKHILWTRFIASVATVALAVLPLACLTDHNVSNAEIVLRHVSEKRKANQSTEGFFITLKPYIYCGANPDDLLYYEDTTYYQISSGKLWTWRKGACMAHAYTGGNTGLEGHWEAPINQESKKSPDAPEGCENFMEHQESYTSVQNGKWNLDINEDSISQSITGTALCRANSYVYNSFGDGADTEIRQQYQVNAMNCESAEVKRLNDNQIITVTSQFLGDSTRIRVQIADKSCTRTRVFYREIGLHCENDTADESESLRFQNCLAEIGLP